MALYEATVKSPMSAEEAFDYLIDLTNLEEWDPGVSEARLDDGSQVGPDGKFFVKANGVKLNYSIDDYDRPKSFGFSAKSLLFTSIDKISFETTESGCNVTYLARLDINLGLSIFDGRVSRRFKQICDDAVVGLADALKGETISSGLQ